MRRCRPTVDLVGTGIVFVVLVAIWAAYFLQYWGRRREHLATARSVEAFSEAMRVLERRPALRASTDSRVSTAYAVSPARVVSAPPASRPQVMAKPHNPAPQHPRGGDLSMRMPTLPRITGAQWRAEQSRPIGAPQPVNRQMGNRQMGNRGRGNRPIGKRGSGARASRQIRGLTFLALVAATVILVALAAAGILLWIAPTVAAAAMLGSFLWLRAGVQAEIRARRASRRTRPAGARQAGARQAGVRRAGARQGVHPSAAAGASRGGRTAGSATEVGEEYDAADLGGAGELRSSTTVLAESDGSASEQAAPQDGPDGWKPVPVPPPTYTLKAKAERPAPVYDNDVAAHNPADHDLAHHDVAAESESVVSTDVEHEVVQNPQQPSREQGAAYGT